VLRDFVSAVQAAGGATPAILAACDSVRDDALTEIGVRLEDASRDGEAATWKLDDSAVPPDRAALRQACGRTTETGGGGRPRGQALKREVAAKREEAAAKAQAGAGKELEKLQKELDRMLKATVPRFPPHI
jgi:hypothetical protein